MPIALPRVALALNVVGEGSALSEGVVTLIRGKAGLRLFEEREDSQGALEGVRCLTLEDSLSSAGDKEMTSAPEGVGIASDSGSSE